MTEHPDVAFFSGLVMGWASRLNENMLSVDIQKLKQDMEEESNRLAKYAGVKLG